MTDRQENTRYFLYLGIGILITIKPSVMYLFKFKNHFSLTLILILATFLVFGQAKPESRTVQIQTHDGNSYFGEILQEDSVKVHFKTDKLGEITILKEDIKNMSNLKTTVIKEGKLWLENPQSTRYFFSPNGYGLKKGEGYYQNIWVLVNSFAVGLNDYLSVGGGLVPLFLFAGTMTPVWLTAKVSVPVVKEQFNVGAGLLAGTALGEQETFGIFYGLATLGSKDKNITLGMGYGFADGSVARSPMINLNGMYRIGTRGYLITENYLFTSGSSSTLILSFGGRTIIREAGLDYGLIIPAVRNMDLIAVPWLGITIPIGRRK